MCFFVEQSHYVMLIGLICLSSSAHPRSILLLNIVSQLLSLDGRRHAIRLPTHPHSARAHVRPQSCSPQGGARLTHDFVAQSFPHQPRRRLRIRCVTFRIPSYSARKLVKRGKSYESDGCRLWASEAETRVRNSSVVKMTDYDERTM